ncbi:hypothetical protein C8J57DRAFT_1214215 [Mycena rebaudengoi]|nr:hypothetical protein C8J57DRAFT_1214215 [Mycena rebaudengoi]
MEQKNVVVSRRSQSTSLLQGKKASAESDRAPVGGSEGAKKPHHSDLKWYRGMVCSAKRERGREEEDARVSQRMELVKAERLRYKESRSSKKRTVDRDNISEQEKARQRGPIVFGNTNDGADISIQIG